ncbi:Methionine import ATP-binding protein MetN 2 [Mycoplasmopsis bovigenitalium]|uniref:Methionine import ATP-binding protein MetN 2 n=1 Tax=Mycoplasmopsis bovigenitalium TaxID=2112 RepID=A0A449A8T4_9BACT|nr:hypothetical protein [Mycoplasmopsis bovigenitalium]VEU60677.1 Methionine import ATP-binding protein MetN 2 [Mycoplasmopsis bovigenitalium]
MAKNKNIFSLEQYFKNNNTSYSEISNLTLHRNSANAFLVLDEESEFANGEIKKIIKSNYAIKTLNYFNENSELIQSVNHKEILDLISFFNLNSVNLKFDTIPLASEYNRIVDNYFASKKKIDFLTSLFEENQYKIQSLLLKLLKENTNEIYGELVDYKREHKQFQNKLLKLINQDSFDELESLVNKHVDYFEWFFENLVSKFVSIINKINTLVKKLSHNYFNSDELKAKIKLKTNYSRLKMLKQMSKTSKESLKRKCFIRDMNKDIEFLEKYRSNSEKTTKKHIRNLIFKYTKSSKLDKQKLNIFSTTSYQYWQIYKSISVLKAVKKEMKYSEPKLRHLSLENIADLNTYINSKISLFIYNNLADSSLRDKKIKKMAIDSIINKEFYLDLSQYIELSRSNEEIICDEIRKLKNKVKKEKSKSLNVFGIESYDAEINKLQNQTELESARIDWNLMLQSQELKNKILQSQIINTNAKNIQNVNLSLTNITKNISKKIKSIIDQNQSKNTKPLGNILEPIRNIYWVYKSISFVFEYIGFIRELVFNKYDFKNKKITYIDVFLRLSEIIETMSFSSKALIKPLNNISNISKYKMGLLSRLFNDSKILFINDDKQIIDHKLKNEFLRITGDLCKQNKITYCFITSNLELIKQNNFDSIFVFFNNKLIEFGRIKKVLSNPLHPIFKSYMSAQNIDKFKQDNIKEYEFPEIYEMSPGQSIIASYNMFKKLSSEGTDGNGLNETIEKTTIIDLESSFNYKDTLIVDLDQYNTYSANLENTQNITREFILYNENNEKNQSDTVFIDNVDAF